MRSSGKVIVLAVVLASCKTSANRGDSRVQGLNGAPTGAADGASTAQAGPDLGAGVYNLFEAQCASCHKADTDSSFNVLNFKGLREAADAQYLDLTSPADSPLYQKLTAQDMPPGASRPKFTADQLALVLSWIQAGALDPQVDASAKIPPLQNPANQAAVAWIQSNYTTYVSPILQAKCSDCHSSAVAVPIQGYVPVIGGVVLADIQQGQAKLNIAGGWPFNQATTIGMMTGDLANLTETIKDNTMPPWKYYVIHPTTALSSSDKQTILWWAAQATTRLQAMQ